MVANTSQFSSIAASLSQFNYTNAFVTLETVEKGLNIVGYIPVVGSFFAHVREYYGSIELISGIALSIFSTVIKSQGDLTNASFYLAIGVTLMGHSILNILRAQIEKKLFLPLVTTLPYDLYGTYILGKRYFSYIQ